MGTILGKFCEIVFKLVLREKNRFTKAHCPPSILMVRSLGISMIFQATTGKKPEIFAWILC